MSTARVVAKEPFPLALYHSVPMRLIRACALKLYLVFLCTAFLHGAELEFTESPAGLPYADFNSVFSMDGNNVLASTTNWSNGSLGATLDAAIYRSNDGGDTWTRHPVETISTGLKNLHFVNSQIGFATAGSRVFRSSDGGATWQQTTLEVEGAQRDLFVLDENHIWGMTESQAYRSVDGGDSWVQFPEISGSLFFLDENVGFMGGEGALAKTTDGGETWNSIPYPSENSGTSMHFFNEDKGLVLSEEGEVFMTLNGGDSWSLHRLVEGNEPENRFSEILFLNENVGFVVGDKIYKTIDGGITWEAKTGEEPRGFDINSIHFSDNQRGFAVGLGSAVARTTDGGETWLIERIGTAHTMIDMEFHTESNGWCLSGEPVVGHILATTSSGMRWSRVELPNKGDSSVWDVEVLDDGSAWAVSSDGKIWSKAANSTEWVSRESISGNELRKIQFYDDAVGWIIGEGVLFRTEDSGESWESRIPGTTSRTANYFVYSRDVAFRSIRYYDPELDTIVGETLKTEDGGASWVEIDNYTRLPYHFQFFNECLGFYMYGDKAIITRDAGKTWEEMAIDLSGYQISDFVSDSVAYIAGNAGRLRKVTIKNAAESLVGTFATDIETAFPMTLTFDTEVGKEYRVQYSADMINWKSVCDRIIATSTSTQWTEDNWPLESFSESGRYYRVLRVGN